MLPGDYVTKVNGQDIANTNKLVQVVGDLLAGKTYDFELIRDGDRKTVSVKLAVRPEDGSDAPGLQEPLDGNDGGARQRPGPQQDPNRIPRGWTAS